MLCSNKEVEERMQELEPSGTNLYPRYNRDTRAPDIRTLVNEFKDDAGSDIPAGNAAAAEIEGMPFHPSATSAAAS
jgi:hypothetical protein